PVRALTAIGGIWGELWVGYPVELTSRRHGRWTWAVSPLVELDAYGTFAPSRNEASLFATVGLSVTYGRKRLGADREANERVELTVGWQKPLIDPPHLDLDSNGLFLARAGFTIGLAEAAYRSPERTP